jgi:hypothetical protein
MAAILVYITIEILAEVSLITIKNTTIKADKVKELGQKEKRDL